MRANEKVQPSDIEKLHTDYSMYFSAQKNAIKSSRDGEFEIYSFLNQASYSVSSNHISE